MGEFWEKITGSIGTGNGAGGSGPPKWFRRDNLLILVLLGVLLFIIALPVKKEEPQAASVGTETAEQYDAGIFHFSFADNRGTGDGGRYRNPGGGSGKRGGIYRLSGGKTEENAGIRPGTGRGGSHDHIGILGGKNCGKRHDRGSFPDRRTGLRRRNPHREFFQYRIPDRLSGRQSGHTVCSEDDHTQSGGVLVVAEGAGKGNMTSEITQIAQALFGVEAHKVKVLEK